MCAFDTIWTFWWWCVVLLNGPITLQETLSFKGSCFPKLSWTRLPAATCVGGTPLYTVLSQHSQMEHIHNLHGPNTCYNTCVFLSTSQPTGLDTKYPADLPYSHRLPRRHLVSFVTDEEQTKWSIVFLISAWDLRLFDNIITQSWDATHKNFLQL